MTSKFYSMGLNVTVTARGVDKEIKLMHEYFKTRDEDSFSPANAPILRDRFQAFKLEK